jgi:thioredoxin reductase (NADPH)
LVLLSRGYCHLCGDMQAALERLQGRFAFDLEVFDVDADATLQAQYDEAVPVLFAGRIAPDAFLCQHFLDLPRVTRWLAA